MGSRSLNAHQKEPNRIPEWVWFEGSTALKEGQAVCYNTDYNRSSGTSATVTPERRNRVELPSTSNNYAFAGVAARDYSAVTGGQLIEINCPGSVCNVYSKADVTINVGRLTFEVGTGGSGQGYFTYAGFPGRGSARPLQTVDRSSTAGKVLAYLETGDESFGVEVVLPVDNAAITPMVGGVTYFVTAVALTNGDCTATLADGTLFGQRKAFVCQAAMTTNEIVVTVTSGLQADGATGLASISFNADLEEAALEWRGFDTEGRWVELHSVGATKA